MYLIQIWGFRGWEQTTGWLSINLACHSLINWTPIEWLCYYFLYSFTTISLHHNTQSTSWIVLLWVYKGMLSPFLCLLFFLDTFYTSGHPKSFELHVSHPHQKALEWGSTLSFPIMTIITHLPSTVTITMTNAHMAQNAARNTPPPNQSITRCQLLLCTRSVALKDLKYCNKYDIDAHLLPQDLNERAPTKTMMANRIATAMVMGMGDKFSVMQVLETAWGEGCWVMWLHGEAQDGKTKTGDKPKDFCRQKTQDL